MQTEQRNEPQAQGWGSFLFRMIMFYFLFNFLFKGKSTPQLDSSGKPLPAMSNLWEEGDSFVWSQLSLELTLLQTIRLFVTTTNDTESINLEDPIWAESNVFYDWQDSNQRQKSLLIPVTEVFSSCLQQTGIAASKK
jgi:hypothetical protein